MPSTDLQHWQTARTPDAAVLQGNRVRLERLDPARHSDDLWLALHGADADPHMWTYMGYGPFASPADFTQWLNSLGNSGDAVFYTVIANSSDQALGLLSYLNI